MNGPVHFVAGKSRDHALDLPPVAKAQEIAVITASLRSCGSLKAGIVAEAVDEVRSLGQRETAMDVRRVHDRAFTARPFHDGRRTGSTGHSPCLGRGLEPKLRLCHGRAMAIQNRRAGGCFLVLAILIGTVWGVSAGNPMKGVLIGTLAGAAIAIAVWLADRIRR